MRKSITEGGMPMLTPEYTFVVYADMGDYWIESYREGVPCEDVASAENPSQVGYHIYRTLERVQEDNDSD